MQFGHKIRMYLQGALTKKEIKVNIAVLFAFKSISGEFAPYLCETLKLNREQHCKTTGYVEVK